MTARHAMRELPPGADPTAPLLDVAGLGVDFITPTGAVRAVDGVRLRVDDGEALGIVGESGSGKTTTALGIAGLLPTTARARGSVRLRGIELLGRSDAELARVRWRELAIVFQGAMNALDPVKRLRDQVAEPLLVHGLADRRGARARADDLLDYVGIPQRRGDAYPHELSGGMRQRATIALALACDPSVVIADEPTTALDVIVQAQVLELLGRLRRDLGLALVLITHDLAVVAESCDRVAVMYAGRVVETGPVGQVVRRPRHPYTTALVEGVPSIRHGRRSLRAIPGAPPDLRSPVVGCPFAPRCAHVIEPCRVEVPALRDVDGGVQVACHHPVAVGHHG